VIFRDRPADDEPAGLLVLHHGRGAACFPSRTRSTRDGGCASSPRGRRSSFPVGPATTGTSCRASATPTRTPSTPPIEGWEPDLAGRRGLRVFVAHGRNDPIMDVGFARRAGELLESAELDVEYHESDVAHSIDPAHVSAAAAWLATTLGHDS
jgi:hypothetical protein